jgi:hypothetical protein
MKLQRAEEHFGQLRLEHALFLDRNPYRMLLEDDPENEGGPHAFLYRAKIIEHPPLEKWASIIGECVHALRSALDHTAYLIVNRDGLVSEDRPAFPLLDNPKYWATTHPDKLPGVSGEVLTLIERLQPYNEAPGWDALLNIHQLDIIDKHRRLNLVNSTVEGTSWDAVNGELVDVEPGIGPFEDGTICGRFRIVPEGGENVHMKTNFVFGIATGEGEPAEGKSLIPLLDRYRAFVGGIVALFEPDV